jgi:hypothetical protein
LLIRVRSIDATDPGSVCPAGGPADFLLNSILHFAMINSF